jgi:hypothetical protein
MAKTDFDLDDRRLCPDGACIGLLGADGRCKVCGLADDGSAAAPLGASSRDDLDDDDVDDDDGIDEDGGDEDDLLAASGEASLAASGDDDPFADRQLCPDGACIGVIGSDGRCKVCRTPARS